MTTDIAYDECSTCALQLSCDVKEGSGGNCPNYGPMYEGERDPNWVDPHAGGAKLDACKPMIRKGFLEQFPRACMEIAKVSEFGANKYTWNGWQSVPNAIERYGDAGQRHAVKALIEGPIDSESGYLHAAHEAWNALARLELILREESNNG